MLNVEEIREKLVKIYNTLNQLEVRGRNNYTALLACMNEIEKLVQEDNDGNIHAESQS